HRHTPGVVRADGRPGATAVQPAGTCATTVAVAHVSGSRGDHRPAGASTPREGPISLGERAPPLIASVTVLSPSTAGSTSTISSVPAWRNSTIPALARADTTTRLSSIPKTNRETPLAARVRETVSCRVPRSGSTTTSASIRDTRNGKALEGEEGAPGPSPRASARATPSTRA